MSRRFVPPGVAVFGQGPEAELARAVLRAREEGFAEGHANGQRLGHEAGKLEGERQAAVAHQAELEALCEKFAKHAAVSGVTEALERVLVTRAGDVAALESATSAAISAALRAVFPVLVAHGAGTEIAALLTDALSERAPDRLTLRASPATLDAVAAQGFPGTHADRLDLLPDPALGPGAAEIAWSGGGLTFDPAALLDRVTALLSPSPAEKD